MLKTQENQDPRCVVFNQWSKHPDVCPALLFRSVGAQAAPVSVPSVGLGGLDVLCSVIATPVSWDFADLRSQ